MNSEYNRFWHGSFGRTHAIGEAASDIKPTSVHVKSNNNSFLSFFGVVGQANDCDEDHLPESKKKRERKQRRDKYFSPPFISICFL